MTTYCALLRGIGPSDPNMRNDRLRAVFNGLGVAKVSSVLSSGNIVFTDVSGAEPSMLEDRIQETLQRDLGIPGGTILRSADELQALVAAAPFGALEHSKATYLTVTFFKRPLDPVPEPFPRPDLDAVELRGYDLSARAVLAVSDTTAARAPDLMSWLERQFTKDITTRTWLTVHRILRRMKDD